MASQHRQRRHHSQLQNGGRRLTLNLSFGEYTVDHGTHAGVIYARPPHIGEDVINHRHEGARDVLESLLLALTHEGVDLNEEPSESPQGRRTITLPFDVVIRRSGEQGHVSSALKEHFTLEPIENLHDHLRGLGAAEALEQYLLSLSQEGHDLSSPAFVRAFETAVESVARPFWRRRIVSARLLDTRDLANLPPH